MSKIKSDGGSSDYYKITVRRASDGQEFECEVGDIIYSLVGGDFDLGNIVKACRRMYLDSKGGGKEGIDAHYDGNKIKWFVDDYVKRVSVPKKPTHVFVPTVPVTQSPIIAGMREPSPPPYVLQGSSIKFDS